MRLLRSVTCDRVRGQISILLDAEVSELDRRLVAAHLARCGECRAFEQNVRAFTDELRAAPLEVPAVPVSIARGRQLRRVWLRPAELGAAAIVLLGVYGVVGQVDRPEPRANAQRATTATLFKTTSWQPEVELAQIDPDVPVRATSGPGPLPAL